MIKRSMQEWCNFTGMIGTISTSGVIIMHETEPKETEGKYSKKIFLAVGAYVAIPRELVSDYTRYGSITRPIK